MGTNRKIPTAGRQRRLYEDGRAVGDISDDRQHFGTGRGQRAGSVAQRALFDIGEHDLHAVGGSPLSDR
jgi:hypothetical protein